jgi:hypothetical protein
MMPLMPLSGKGSYPGQLAGMVLKHCGINMLIVQHTGMPSLNSWPITLAVLISRGGFTGSIQDVIAGNRIGVRVEAVENFTLTVKEC